MNRLAAMALGNLAHRQSQLGQNEAALDTWTEVRVRFRNSGDPEVAAIVDTAQLEVSIRGGGIRTRVGGASLQ